MSSVPEEILNPFVEGLKVTLKVQCFTDCTAETPFPRDSSFQNNQQQVAAIMGLASSKFSGVVSLVFPITTFLFLMGRTMKQDLETITPEIADAPGEILNIAVGQARRVLNEKGYDLQKALPLVTSGKYLSLFHFTPDPAMIVPFKTEGGSFYIEIGIR